MHRERYIRGRIIRHYNTIQIPNIIVWIVTNYGIYILLNKLKLQSYISIPEFEITYNLNFLIVPF